mmetsp:Transcript_26978/g.30323  ORF Transcript_26978/g.30323 Transcript_26978/m.30323 type:complete len:103 (+) Transcript_26978:47-355(+)
MIPHSSNASNFSPTQFVAIGPDLGHGGIASARQGIFLYGYDTIHLSPLPHERCHAPLRDSHRASTGSGGMYSCSIPIQEPQFNRERPSHPVSQWYFVPVSLV